MIPKIVHYVWIGGKKPKSIENNINNWKKILNDYEFIEWNQNNWDINSNRFAKYFFSKGKKSYAFVSDAIRVDVLDRYGGIYMDTDVHVYKSFDSLLSEHLVLGRIYNNAVGTANIMSEKNNPTIHKLNEFYKFIDTSKLENSHFDKINNGIFTRYFLNNKLGMNFSNKTQRLKDGTLLLPKQYLEIPNFWFEKGGYSVHDQMGSWHGGFGKTSGVKDKIKKAVGVVSPAIIPRYQSKRAEKNNSIAIEFPDHK